MKTSCARSERKESHILRIYNPDTYSSTSYQDRKLFFTIQMSVYMHYKKQSIRSRAEKDMLEDLLSVYWEEIEKSGILDGKTQTEKQCICRACKIYFPLREIPDYLRQN